MKSALHGPELPPPKHETMVAALRSAARSDCGVTFVDGREDETFVPFSRVLERADRAAGALRDRGVSRGDRVAIVAKTGPSFLDAFFGAWLLGAVPVPLYPPLRLGRLEEYLESTARMMRAARVALVVADGDVRRIVGRAVASARPPLGCVDALELEGTGGVVTAIAPDDLGVIQFSSGSTVDPKPVALSHRNLVAQCAALEATFPKERDGAPVRHSGVSWLPLYHDMGLIGCLLTAVFLPGNLALLAPERFLVRPSLWLRAIARHRATISSAPSFAYALCTRRIKDEELEGVDLSSWMLALDGAEPVSLEVLERFAERFSKLGFDARAATPVYGLAEASLAVTFSDVHRRAGGARVDPETLAREGRVGSGERVVPSVGRPVASMSIEVRDQSGAIVDQGVVGRIFVRGPSVMTGYFEQPERTAEAIVDGWLDTGDLGFVLDGELHVTGREKDVVIVRGANHAPQTFERAAESVEGVRAGCVVALSDVDPGVGERLLLLAEHASDLPPSSDLAARVETAVCDATGVRPDVVCILSPGTLPRTSSGKLRRREALRRFREGSLAPPSKVTAFGIAKEIVRSSLAYALARLP